MDTSLKIFSDNLRNILTARRMSQTEFAKTLKTTKATVSRWVNGTTMPRPSTIDRICVVLSCTTEDLLSDHNKTVKVPEDVLAEELMNNPRLMRIMFKLMKLSDDELTKVERLMP